MACDRYQISDSAGAAIITSTLKDHRLIDEDDQSLVIDRNRLRRQRAKFREAVREEETNLFKLVDGIYLDRRKDATQVICSINEKFYRNAILEEQYVIVGEPGEFCLTHSTPLTKKEQHLRNACMTQLKIPLSQKSLL